jgi:hypothetical protein
VPGMATDRRTCGSVAMTLVALTLGGCCSSTGQDPELATHRAAQKGILISGGTPVIAHSAAEVERLRSEYPAGDILLMDDQDRK